MYPIYSVHPNANPTPYRTAVLFEQTGARVEENDRAQRGDGADDTSWRRFCDSLDAGDWDTMHAYCEYRGVFGQRLDEAGYVLH